MTSREKTGTREGHRQAKPRKPRVPRHRTSKVILLGYGKHRKTIQECVRCRKSSLNGRVGEMFWSGFWAILGPGLWLTAAPGGSTSTELKYAFSGHAKNTLPREKTCLPDPDGPENPIKIQVGKFYQEEISTKKFQLQK